MPADERIDSDVLTGTDEDAALHEAPWRRLVVLGDSIAEAKLADPVDGLESLGWPRRVARALARQQPDLELVNLGARDLTASRVRESQLAPALEHCPDLAAVICGGNDVLARDFDVEATRAEIDTIVEALRSAPADVLMLTTFDTAGSLDLPGKLAERIATRMAALADAIRSIAEARGAILVDLFELERGADPGIFSADQIHANELGHAVIASHVVAALGHRLGTDRD